MALRQYHHKFVRMMRAMRRLPGLELELDMLRSRIELGVDAFDEFQAARAGADYQSAFQVSEPVVSVCIPTFNRAELLTERCVPSILNQSYGNLQVIVVGDNCTDDTEARIARIADDRLVFVNLPERGPYPEDRMRRWMVAGTTPMNHALSLATGHFVTHLDDDDEYLPERIEKLVEFSKSNKPDLVFHPFYREVSAGKWRISPAHEFTMGNITTSSIFYHGWLARIGWDITAHLLMEPGDWNRLRRFKYLGAKILRYPHPLLRHHAERNQTS